MAKTIGLPEMDFLDLGGGFAVNPLSNPENTFSLVAPKIRNYLNEENFPGISKVKIIGEPGRFISQEALSIVVQIYLVRQQKTARHYFVNSGVYQGFGSQVYDR